MKRLEWLLLLAFVASVSTAVAPRRRRHSTVDTPASSLSDWSSGWGFGPEMALVRRVYDDCQDKNDFIGCLKQKALHALSRALDQDSIKIVDGLVLEKQNQSETESILGSLTDARQFGNMGPIDRALLSKADKLMRTHTLKIDMDGGTGIEEENAVGRGHGHGHKKKKHKDGGHIKYVVAALLTAMGIAGPLGLKALAAIAGKALVISKVALTIAGIIALKKLFSHDHSEETSFQVHAGEHNRRNTYVIRPVSKTSGGAGAGGVGVSAAGGSSSVDPYRYYYEYHQQ
ncbi:uncharacterized protein LOC108111655 [Drosophila eugracilis]|uniref:uncharacterized protein LOC108111655 n=1 Tax=Drosophila eugracilis TaxID=29029 RepID=UPI001BDB5996|nr:uncharacterized protein LOC108111655 [Drosophila eugracilis]